MGYVRLILLLGQEKIFVKFGPRMMLDMHQIYFYVSFMLLLYSIHLECVPVDSPKMSIF